MDSACPVLPPAMDQPMPQAVFLSYAREDTAAAQRLAEALRSHGVEVWFDQNELRGGDSPRARGRRTEIRGQRTEVRDQMVGDLAAQSGSSQRLPRWRSCPASISHFDRSPERR